MQQPRRRGAQDLEQKEARRAEAGLQQRLRALETARLVHARMWAWEQRQLWRDLQRLRQEINKKRNASSFRGAPQAGPPRPRVHPALKIGSRVPESKEQPFPPNGRGVRPPSAPDMEAASIQLQQGGEGPTNSPEPSTSPSREASPAPPADAQQVPGNPQSPPPEGKEVAPLDLELLARAGRAHYVRHRQPPLWEQLLSVREVFGHQNAAGHGGPSAP